MTTFYSRFGNPIDHYHVVAGGKSIEEEHAAWHAAGLEGPGCALCGKHSWTSCAVFLDGSRGGPYCYKLEREA